MADVLVGVVRRAHQRAGLAVAEAEAERELAEAGELVRRHEAVDRQVFLVGWR